MWRRFDESFLMMTSSVNCVICIVNARRSPVSVGLMSSRGVHRRGPDRQEEGSRAGSLLPFAVLVELLKGLLKSGTVSCNRNCTRNGKRNAGGNELSCW